jgi:formate dehydrogenase iron-sulfur subunit
MGKAVLCDATKCIGCRACQVACKQWNGLPAVTTTNTGSYENPPKMDAYTFTKINFTELEDNGRFRWVFNKLQCMHCEHPACVEACIVGALEKRPDGPVTYDDRKCIGCRYCQVACPFGIPNFEWDKPMPWIRKCTFCADRQGAGLKPACVTTCPTGALEFGERDALIAEAHRRIAAEPGKYVDHVYGEKEVGGTSWLYLSPVSFEKLGFPTLGYVPVTVNVARAMGAVPPVLLGVAAAMAGIYWLTKRRQKSSQAEADEKQKARLTK